MSKEDLDSCVVEIQVGGKRKGTGFFIGTDGSLLTCFHVVGNKETGLLTKKPITVWFKDVSYETCCLFTPEEPDKLDFVILRVTDEKLPRQASLLPMGRYESTPGISHTIRSLGFRPLDDVQGSLPAVGEFKVKASDELETPWLLLSLVSGHEEDFRPGMSGAPLYDDTADKIVGMICKRYGVGETKTPEESPAALPIETIAEHWRPLRRRLEHDRLLDQFYRVYSSKRLLTSDLFGLIYERLREAMPELKPYESLGSDKLKSLIDQVRQTGHVYSLLNYLRADWPKLPRVQPEPPTSANVRFVNREREFRSACDLSAPPLIIFDAPWGYGKTSLLEAIETDHFYKGWLSAFVDLPKDTMNAAEVASQVAIEADCYPPGDIEIEKKGDTLALQLQDRIGRYKAPGIVLLIDNVDRLPEAEMRSFFGGLLKAMRSRLGTNLRVRLAGAYLAARLDLAELPPMSVQPLEPFTFQTVRETTRLVLHPGDQGEAESSTRKEILPPTKIDSIAAHLMYITGGHPGCMIRVLNQLKRVHLDGRPDEIFHKYREILEKICKGYTDRVATQIHRTLPEPLSEVFEILSVYRKYNVRLLKEILTTVNPRYNQDLELEKRVLMLEEDLTATYMVRRVDRFIQDEIMRRMLALWLFRTKTSQFLDWCKQAKQIYEDDLKTVGCEPETIAIEGLYQELRYGYCSGGSTIENRKDLRDEFFAPDGTLDRYLGLLAGQNELAFEDTRRNLLNALKEDWEFRFSINFFLRRDYYDDKPYEQMRRVIEQFGT